MTVLAPIPRVDPRAEIDVLLGLLPERLQRSIGSIDAESLLELVLDLGRIAEARFPDHIVPLGDTPVDLSDIEHIVSRVGDFNADNRVGIPKTLHRISAIRNRQGRIIGLTLRVGRAVLGTIDLLRDLIETGSNILLLGPPGVGKTTKLREMARLLSDDYGKRVIVIDTSNEIGGDGDIPHPAIGGARRMQVPRPDRQHSVMIEAVENHMPEAIIVDEIGTEAEALAARTIAERGVQLIGTAHGTTLENLVLNPTLSDLIGGVHAVILGDEEARRQGRSKTVSERKAPPTFDIVVELVDRDEVIVHKEAAESVDSLLSGRSPRGERRRRISRGQIETAPTPSAPPLLAMTGAGPARIYAYELNRGLLERVIRNMEVSARTVNHLESADLIFAPRSRAEDPRLEQIRERTDAPLHLLKKDNATYMRRALRDLFAVAVGLDTEEVRDALQETEHAIQRVLNERVAEVSLAPRKPPIRKMQHRIIARYHLETESTGREPFRHLVIHHAR